MPLFDAAIDQPVELIHLRHEAFDMISDK